MAESNETHENIAYIRTHVDNLERFVRFQISTSKEHRNSLRERFAERPGMAEAYLALKDGALTQEQLVDKLGLSQPTISRVVGDLVDAGIIEPHRSKGNRSASYRWTDLERLLKVSRLAEEDLQRRRRAADQRSPPQTGAKKKPKPGGGSDGE